MSPVRRGELLPIHNRIAVLRAERRMSRVELAGAVEVNPQTIGALERGDHFPSLDLAFRICGVFGLPVEAVFSRTKFSPLSAQHWSPERTRHDGTGGRDDERRDTRATRTEDGVAASARRPAPAPAALRGPGVPLAAGLAHPASATRRGAVQGACTCSARTMPTRWHTR